MSSVTQDPWLTENSPVDDLGVVELFFKSLDSSGTGVSDHCWTAIAGTDTTTDTNFTTPTPSEKIGYEPFSLPSLANCLKDTLEIKQEPCDESCPLVDQSPETLDIGIQCTASLPSLQEFSSFRYSSQLPR